MLLIPLTICFTTLMVESMAKNPELNSQPSLDNITVVEKWELLEKKLKGAVNSLIKMAMPKIMEVSMTLNVSSQCMKDSMVLITGIKNIRPWALRIIDSSAKIIDGMMDGSMSAFGAYDECLDTLAPSLRDKNRVMFRGQYCTVLIKPPLPPKPYFYKMDEVLDELRNFSTRPTALGEAAKFAQAFYVFSVQLGICIPSGCSLEDLNKLIAMMSKNLAIEAKASRCEVKTEPEITNPFICVMCGVSFVGSLLVVGTLIDVYTHYYKRVFTHKAVKIILAFSLFTNFKKLVNTDTSSENLCCLHGVRFLGIAWIVLSHTYYTINFQLLNGLRSANTIPRGFAFQAIANGSVAVDTFFFMGGLLVCYFTVKAVKKENRRLNLTMYILHRFWRIVPVYIFLIIMFIFVPPLFGSGPLWHDTLDPYYEDCFNNWWTNLIFINNFYNANHMCFPQSWYVASDIQLYIAALLVIIPLIRWPKIGIGFSVIGILTSMVYGGISTYVNKYPPAMLAVHVDPNQTMDYWSNFYFKPFIHAGPYCIGLLAGYLLVMKPDLKIPKVVLVLGWCLAICFNMSVLYGTWQWNKGVKPTFLETMLYSSCNRVVWTLGVAWMVVCCCIGYGGVVNYILSWKCWIPLGRLTFTIYLIHPMVQILIMANMRTTLQPSHFIAVWLFFGHLCVTCGCAFVATMLVEAPFLSLEKIIFPPSSKVKKENFVINNNNYLKWVKGGDIAVIVPEATSDEVKKYKETYIRRRLS